MHQANKQKDCIKAIKKIHGGIQYEYEVEAEKKLNFWAEPYGPVWLREVVGIDYFNNVTKVFLSSSSVTDSDLQALEGLKHLKQVNLIDTHITDAGLEHLYGLKQLEYVLLMGTPVTDAGVKKLQGALPHCKIKR